jgi:hypothetical protein
MKKLSIWLALLVLTLASCRPMAPAPGIEPVSSTEVEPSTAPTATVGAPADLPTASPSLLPSPMMTPTETPLPPLTLPSPQPNAPDRQVWDGVPTYPAESVQGLYFRLSFDPTLWALTQNQFGQPALGHREIPYCVITPASGRGLPPDWRVDHSMRQIGSLFYDVGSAYENNRLRFVTYLGGDGQVFTGFEVSFEENVEACLADADAVMSTLTSILETEASVTP